MNILTVIVTHNRRELLRRCLQNVRAQVREPDEIVVINNGSTDGTEDMLDVLGVKFISQDNVGSAGGWHRGIAYGLENNFDAVWLMDDDGFPEKTALSVLENSLKDDVVCASSVVLQEDRRTHFVFPVPVLNGNGLPKIFAFPRKFYTLASLRSRAPRGVYPFAHLFNGALVSLAAVSNVGNVDRRFYIFGEEVDYFFRLRRSGQVVSVLSAIHYHPNVAARPYTPAKVFYYLRNTLVLHKRYFDMVLIRNCLAILVVLGRTARRNGLRVAIAHLAGRHAKNFARSILEGLRGSLGRKFDV